MKDDSIEGMYNPLKECAVISKYKELVFPFITYVPLAFTSVG
ncbi:hypothetical protein SLEP1_g27099 [Rubroshorea leprosula]|uniref:Uncharacterized protein n=1 Tax=Rubroshorea leprosula TaxID=152421 RepID=A0AAV5JPH3_9ROSI|nr:hypothetical protein SLEP1_g27099 [Rubroshorea leprosula]